MLFLSSFLVLFFRSATDMGYATQPTRPSGNENVEPAQRPPPEPPRKSPLHLPALLALFISVLAMASGGLWFALLQGTPPLMKACWRLLLTALLQGAGFACQSRGLPPPFWARFRDSIPHLIAIGFSLALHFGSWCWSVDNTSLAHSLLLVWTTPLLLVVWMFLRGRAGFSGASPTTGEALGAALGFSGVALLLGAGAERATEAGVTLGGDAAALLGAAAIIPYLQGGAELRAWMPLFV